MSLKLFAAVTIRKNNRKTLHHVDIPDDLMPWVSYCNGDCLSNIDSTCNHEVCLYEMKKHCIINPEIVIALGRMDYLEYIREFEYPWKPWLLGRAARYGRLDVIKYLQKDNCPWSEWTSAHAAGHGHLDCLKYLFENGCPCGTLTMSNAALFGRLDCLKYLRGIGCPWDKMATSYAAQNGGLECLKYLCENGCPIDTEYVLSKILTEVTREYVLSL